MSEYDQEYELDVEPVYSYADTNDTMYDHYHGYDVNPNEDAKDKESRGVY